MEDPSCPAAAALNEPLICNKDHHQHHHYHHSCSHDDLDGFSSSSSAIANVEAMQQEIGDHRDGDFSCTFWQQQQQQQQQTDENGIIISDIALPLLLTFQFWVTLKIDRGNSDNEKSNEEVEDLSWSLVGMSILLFSMSAYHYRRLMMSKTRAGAATVGTTILGLVPELLTSAVLCLILFSQAPLACQVLLWSAFALVAGLMLVEIRKCAY